MSRTQTTKIAYEMMVQPLYGATIYIHNLSGKELKGISETLKTPIEHQSEKSDVNYSMTQYEIQITDDLRICLKFFS